MLFKKNQIQVSWILEVYHSKTSFFILVMIDIQFEELQDIAA